MPSYAAKHANFSGYIKQNVMHSCVLDSNSLSAFRYNQIQDISMCALCMILSNHCNFTDFVNSGDTVLYGIVSFQSQVVVFQ